jgi:hypothetical protein
MGWLDKTYKCFVLILQPDSKKLWYYENWKIIADQMSSSLKIDRKNLALRTLQLSMLDKKELKFGRLNLSDDSIIKWTHKSPITIDISKDWFFQDVEGWFPSWSNCSKNNESPDLYFALSNEKSIRLEKPILFDQVLLMAFSISEYSSTAINNFINALKFNFKPTLIATKERKWAKELSIGFTDAMNDIIITGLFKIGDRHNRPIDLNTFAEEWDLY